MHLPPGLTAQRFAGKPLRQPSYSMRDVPYCNKDLSGSIVGEVTDRESFNDAMAEMVLLCNEVMRRKSQQDEDGDAQSISTSTSRSNSRSKNQGKKVKKKASKPLSLEYLADRCDVDDPIWGFIVRSEVNMMMQGFVTVTTFTNWQASFRWDSMHDSAFSYDDQEMAEAMASKERKYDENGSLAAEIQNTVRCGDPWNEGIVWPHVAEISLLGGLGCGKALLALAIERLEAMPAASGHNYHYVVLQATNNSIPFYESMGFVRVGAVTENKEKTNAEASLHDKSDDKNESSDKENVECAPKEQEIVSGPVKRVTATSRESLRKFCGRLNVDVWDVLFLNKDIFPGITHKSVLQKDTALFIPDLTKLDGSSNATLNENGGNGSTTQWYDAKDNETPREIAKKFNICYKQLLAANKGRIQGLQVHSKLVEGTRIQVSNLDVHYDAHVPYCHWTFPDDKFENNEPSYMMARRLNRKSRQEAKLKPVENSFAISVTKYNPPPSEQKNPNLVGKKEPIKSPSTKTPKRKSKKRKLHPDEPIRPKKPKTGFFFFCDDERSKMNEDDQKMRTADFIKRSSMRWKELSEMEKNSYNMKREAEVAQYEERMKEYKAEMEKFKSEHPEWKESKVVEDSPAKTKMPKNLFNKVIRLNDEGQREAGTEFQYYYVLTYIPDLFWVHLAPMRQKGVFGTRWPKVKGQKKWVLVGEGEGKELDISATVCEVVKSRCMKKCNDADKEEWVINDPDYVDVTSPSTKSALPSSASSTVSLASTSTSKEGNVASSVENSDCDADPIGDGLIQKDTMYSRLLRKQRQQ